MKPMSISKLNAGDLFAYINENPQRYKVTSTELLGDVIRMSATIINCGREISFYSMPDVQVVRLERSA